MNQREVAERLGIGSHSILSELENGQRRLDVVELISLAALYGKEPAWFLGAEGAEALGGGHPLGGHLTIDGQITVGGRLDTPGGEIVLDAAGVKPVVEIMAQVDATAQVATATNEPELG